MTLNVITNSEKAPVFISINPLVLTKRDVDQYLPLLTGEQSNLINSIIDTYGFEVEAYVHGDPRKVFNLNCNVKSLGFYDGKFGILHELPLTASTESEVTLLVGKLSEKLRSEQLGLTSKYDHTEFFITHHEGSFEYVPCLVAFTEFKVDGMSFTSPYADEMALEELTKQLVAAVSEA